MAATSKVGVIVTPYVGFIAAAGRGFLSHPDELLLQQLINTCPESSLNVSLRASVKAPPLGWQGCWREAPLKQGVIGGYIMSQLSSHPRGLPVQPMYCCIVFGVSLGLETLHLAALSNNPTESEQKDAGVLK